MKTINITKEIHAPAQKVWQVLWDKDSYRKWAAAFMEGSHYEGELAEGNTVKFLDPKENGMLSTVTKISVPHEIRFEHQSEIEEGKPGKDLGSLKEIYSLEENQGITTLRIESDLPGEYAAEMEQSTHEALEKIKELAEA